MPLTKKTILGLTALAAAGAAALGYGLRSAPPAATKNARLPLVSVTQARYQDLPHELAAQGHLVALNQVEVRPQVTATIQAVHFREGEDVQAGQLLFTLEDADARALLQRAEGQAAQIQAQLADARRDFQRASTLVKSAFIAPSAVDTAASKVDALQAQFKAAQGEVASARVALTHTRITAPISARSGAVAVHPGSLAQAGSAAPLVTLAQFSPIGVEFSLPEQELPLILRARRSGPVAVRIEGPEGSAVTGQLSFIDNLVHTGTGTVALKATVANQDHMLWPGGYVRVTVLAGMDRNAVVLPPQAVQEGPNGRFVYVVGADQRATQQPVTLQRMQGDLAVLSGLASGTRVVLEGGAHLRPGASVRIVAAAKEQARP